MRAGAAVVAEEGEEGAEGAADQHEALSALLVLKLSLGGRSALDDSTLDARLDTLRLCGIVPGLAKQTNTIRFIK